MVQPASYTTVDGKTALRVAVESSVKPKGSRGDNSYTILTSSDGSYSTENKGERTRRVVVDIPTEATAADISVENSETFQAMPFHATVRETEEAAGKVEQDQMSRFTSREHRINLPRDLYTFRSSLVVMLPKSCTLYVTWLRELQ